MKRIFTLALSMLFLCFAAKAQVTFPVNGTTNPKHLTYAFRNAKIFTDYKTSIDSATLLIRDGYVIDAGKNITIPTDAVVYDLKGKFIYPSLIDIFTAYGLPDVPKRKDEETPQFLSATKGAYGWNQAIRAEYEAHKNFSAEPKEADELRKMFFGAVVSVNRDGIARGTSAIVSLGDGNENDFFIKDRAAANYSFDKGSSSQDYPSSLMGTIALLRQTYYDAQWYINGGYKKEYNISLDAWNKIQDLPQVFEAGDKQNELRADKIGDEFGVKYIIKGNGEEYQRINEIKEMNDALIIPLNFPEAFDVTDPYDAMNITLGQMKHWELAPTNPAAVEKAGIPFAITTADLKEKKDFWKNLRKAIENGLSEEAALKALTQTPAELLKISDQAGALKKGMLANFVVTSKNIFAKDVVLYDNWVKGVRYKYADYDAKDIRGTYSLKVDALPELKLRVNGEMNSPDMNVADDSAMSKVTYTRLNNLITLQFEKKKSEPKGIFRLSGYVSDENPNSWRGTGQMPNGEWVSWSARLDSSFVQPARRDTTKKDSLRYGVVTYPFMAYGWKEMPVQKTVLFKNATVWTNEAEGILQNADVLISGGKIQKVGKNLSDPAAEIIDAAGKNLTSGIIDEHSHICASGDLNEGTQSSSAEVRVADVIDAEDINLYRQLAGGVTCSHILHGSANAIGGQTQLIKERWGASPEKMKFQGWPGFIKFALGENVKQSNWGDKQVTRFPQTRMGVEQVYTDYFTRAKEYSPLTPKGGTTAVPVKRDLELDALKEILDGKRFITCHSYEQSEINMLIHVADSFGFKVNTFTHILEGYKVADKMKAHGVLGASSFADWWAYKFEVYEAIPYNGALMHGVGLNVSFNSDDAEMARRLNQEAAKAVKYGGVSEVEAWKFVTLNPAKMLHVDDKVGSVKVGKDADLVLWSDNPLSIYAQPLQTYVDGIKYFDVETDKQLREETRKERARLIQKMIDAKNKGENTQKPALKALTLHHCLDDEYLIIE
jgi:imidazolonepropionase-like amidohydrolase